MKNKIFLLMAILSSLVFFLAFLSLIYGDFLDEQFNVIGIRIATIIVSFASFISSTTFSFLVYYHNRTVSKLNDDMNKRAEMFRELQFASSNYSIIEFMDRMKISMESTRYIDKYVRKGSFYYHMLESSISDKDVLANPDNYDYVSIRIPFRVIEGKTVSYITLDSLSFERDNKKFIFKKPSLLEECRVFILYNEITQRKNIIVNLILPKDINFFNKEKINHFSKIKIKLNIISLLGVKVNGVSELYFTNPEQIEGDGTNTYRINSSNLTLSEMPTILPIDTSI
ncbi:TPA: hypothetical protein GXZ54_06695 [bacterium]|nr:hypothetical protein [bacterium]